jgi:hypothetical protein
MNPVICLQHNFFDVLPSQSDLTFKDVQLSVDGVTYPHICTEVPKALEYEFLYKLERALGARVVPEYLFFRAMPEGCTAPSKIHSDRDLAAFTAHVYLSPGSTSFYRHKELGYEAFPFNNGSEWSQDKGEWQKYLTVVGEPNLLVVHHAAPFHCAEPESGYGTLGIDARCVLTSFFNVT